MHHLTAGIALGIGAQLRQDLRHPEPQIGSHKENGCSVAGNDSSKHTDGGEPDLTEEQRAAVDRLRNELETLPLGRR